MANNCLLDLVMEPGGLTTLFQPILEARNLGWKLHSLECLTRGPVESNLASADVLFEYVRRKGSEEQIDRACVARALREASEVSVDTSFSLNIHASTLGRDPEFPSFLADMAEANSIPTSCLVVEIVEHTPCWDAVIFRDSLAELRSMGVRVALDDIGVKHSNLRMVLDSRPDYFKIDRYLVEGCRDDSYRRAILESIAGLARSVGARVIAEGVESVSDLDVISNIGIELVQGHLFYPAMPIIELLETEALAGQTVFPFRGGEAAREQA